MKMRPGCGCAIAALGAFNVLLVLTSIYGLITGAKIECPECGAEIISRNLLQVPLIVVFALDAVVCVMLALPRLREGGFGGGGGGSAGEGVEEGEEDEDKD